MAKKTYGHVEGKDGKPVIVEIAAATKAQKASLQLIPLTKAPSRIARALWH